MGHGSNNEEPQINPDIYIKRGVIEKGKTLTNNDCENSYKGATPPIAIKPYMVCVKLDDGYQTCEVRCLTNKV